LESLSIPSPDYNMTVQINSVYDSVTFPVLCIDQEGTIFRANQGACDISGYSQGEIERLSLDELFTSHSINGTVSIQQLSSNQSTDMHLIHKSGNVVPVQCQVSHETNPDQYFLMLYDLSPAKKTEEKLTVQIERMRALGKIDRAIISTMDIAFITDVVFDQICSQLHMDCSLLFMDVKNSPGLTCQHSRGLSLMSGNGSRPDCPQPIMANRVAASGETIIIEDISQTHQFSNDSSAFPYQNIKFYAGIPLLNLGETIGVLEVCSTQPFKPDSEWVNFLELIAGQTTIAIVHVTQFHDIRRLNAELLNSYENTLEGWARVLEFKDQETKGHSDRVTKMAENLGKAMGLTSEELVHLRHGAILHDIGKLCVPEGILLKDGPLDDDEWNVMKQHPVYAQEFVADIQFLQPSTNIMLFHHERWDGSGYPLGLRGKQIPLAARIFMVIDVWDALSFDRPYRKAWPVEKVQEYLQVNAGVLFDPEIIELFMEIIS
jgi:PAS domain S-box-containing protein